MESWTVHGSQAHSLAYTLVEHAAALCELLRWPHRDWMLKSLSLQKSSAALALASFLSTQTHLHTASTPLMRMDMSLALMCARISLC